MSSQIVREMQRTTAMKGDWRRGFGVGTFILSAFCGFAVMIYGIPEKDYKGRDHVLSGVQRYYKAKRDEFFGLPPINKQETEVVKTIPVAKSTTTA